MLKTGSELKIEHPRFILRLELANKFKPKVVDTTDSIVTVPVLNASFNVAVALLFPKEINVESKSELFGFFVQV